MRKIWRKVMKKPFFNKMKDTCIAIKYFYIPVLTYINHSLLLTCCSLIWDGWKDVENAVVKWQKNV